jgi:hypothetical protein
LFVFQDALEHAFHQAHGGNSLGSGTDGYGFIGVGSEAGSYDGTPGPVFYMNGIIDGHRISSVAGSVKWIATVYNNQDSPETFYSRKRGKTGLRFVYFT